MGLLFLLFIVTPIVELVLLTRLGRVVGFAPTVAFVIGMGFLGVVLARTQGRRVLRDWQSAIAQGRVPEEGIVGGVLALLGAVLLITPGILTDVVGLALLVPALRKAIARLVSAYLARQMAAGRLRVYGMGASPPARPVDGEAGRARYRPGEVIDTQGEEVP